MNGADLERHAECLRPLRDGFLQAYENDVFRDGLDPALSLDRQAYPRALSGAASAVGQAEEALRRAIELDRFRQGKGTVE